MATQPANAPQPAADPLAHIPPEIRATMQRGREDFAAIMAKPHASAEQRAAQPARTFRR